MTDSSILVSIVIPMRNEEKYIGKCLDSVMANNFPRERYEILCADGESTDKTREIVNAKAAQHPMIRLFDNPGKVVPPGMNILLREAKGKYIIRMDAHSEYPPDYIENCVAELDRTGAANVGGIWITRPGAHTTVAEAIAYMTQAPATVGNALYRLGTSGRYVDTVPFGAFRREIFDRVGFFREDLVRHQDYELNARIRKAGGKIYLSPKIYNVYYNVPNFQKFMRQAWMNGIWVARAWRRYPVSFCWRHAAPLAFVMGILASCIPMLISASLFWVPLLYLASYCLVALATGAKIAAKHGWRHLFLIPALMFSYHFVYGTGSIVGLLTAYAGLSTRTTDVAGSEAVS